ncbi:hypothetical protein N7462_003125 [Penicillium macrosclerotiorum]|uniref:uncharacterized protein n=1 Tax=Penicillium macrosclerotiorum TaxID=303699 RepID=UPI002547E8F9|nr:uncharacterized protein N7462_003125 [Penicillium macrosclerotiorum]KAJ5688733.1 hypothetical protein N7462_003125 [Penicillium macrosclerotiorum]
MSFSWVKYFAGERASFQREMNDLIETLKTQTGQEYHVARYIDANVHCLEDMFIKNPKSPRSFCFPRNLALLLDICEKQAKLLRDKHDPSRAWKAVIALELAALRMGRMTLTGDFEGDEEASQNERYAVLKERDWERTGVFLESRELLAKRALQRIIWKQLAFAKVKDCNCPRCNDKLPGRTWI